MPTPSLVRRFAALAALGLALSGCAGHIHLTQDTGQVIARTGIVDTFDERQPAGPVAARLLPYALIAEQSYRDENYQGGRVPEIARVCPTDDPRGCRGFDADIARARRLLGGWRLVSSCDGPDQCNTNQSGIKTAIGGLGVQVWARRGAVCREVIISFRGTVGGSSGDLVTNLHWITRALPVYDQYDQVRDYIARFIGKIKNIPCYRGGTTQITAIGHSLGGGLAQLSAYADGNIRRVYAIDPSFVTGYYSSSLPNRDANAAGLRSERVYEHGEILAYGRYILRQFVPPTPCNPRIVNLRFNVLRGSPFAQHNLSDFTTGLLRAAHGEAAERKPLVLEKPLAVEKCETGKPPQGLTVAR